MSADDPILDGDEIQGNIVPGFSKDFQTLLMLQMVDVAAARRWLGWLSRRVASLHEVLGFKRLFEATRRRRGEEGAVRSTWINVALGPGALLRLGGEVGRVQDAAFREGMVTRAARLGDSLDPADPGHASRWRFGAAPAVDVLVLLASDDVAYLTREVARVAAAAQPGLRVLFEQRGATLPPPLRGHEPFGYADGISQPRLRGRLSTRPGDELTPRAAPGAAPARERPGTGLVQPGEFLFGYPTEPGPIADGGAPWMRNGSFLVLRRYVQDVEGLQRWLAETAPALAASEPRLRDLTAERLSAMLIGRWQSGAPLPLAPSADQPSLGADDARNNDFGFRGSACPYAAHIRRANPRDDGEASGPDAVQRHRLLRRGIPFADERLGERGLVFVAYAASIERQFEFLFERWLNDPDQGRGGAGCDPLVGVGPTGRTFTVPVDPSGAGPVLTLPTWTWPTGGGYFFVPSIGTLAQMAG